MRIKPKYWHHRKTTEIKDATVAGSCTYVTYRLVGLSEFIALTLGSTIVVNSEDLTSFYLSGKLVGQIHEKNSSESNPVCEHRLFDVVRSA